MKTRAAILFEPENPLEVVTLDLEPPRAREVLVKMAAAGICRSDWQLCSGATPHPMPVVLGHEGTGLVEAVGDEVLDISPGDRVILNWAASCNHCFYCLRGRPGLCQSFATPIWQGALVDGTTRLSLNGAPVHHYCALSCFADYAVVPAEACVVICEDIPDTVAALIGCAVTTGVGAVLNTANVSPGSSAAVFGVGGVGLSTLMGLRLAEASPVLAIDTMNHREELALAFGAGTFIAAQQDVIAILGDLTGGRGVDFAFEATGSPAVQEQCLQAIRPGGTAVFIGLTPVGSSTHLSGAVITRQEKTVTGSYYGSSLPRRDFRKYVQYYLQGRLALDSLVTKTYALDNINEAFADLVGGSLARGVVLL